MPVKPDVAQVIPLIGKLETFINEEQYLPATRHYRGIVILALVSKTLTVGRAVCTLVETGFPAEAFGLSRTLVEIFLTVRYMGNSETEIRTKRFAEYFAKAHEGWIKIIQKYYPATAVPNSAEHQTYLDIARSYPLANEWTGIRGQIRQMAIEPDAFEVDASRKPINFEFDYEVIYKWTSYFVHATVSCLESHCTEDGEIFRVHARKELDQNRGHDALFNVVAYLHKTIVAAYRAMRQDQPEEILTELHNLLTSYAK